MAEYNFQPNLHGSNAGTAASAFESAPFAPVMDQSASWIIHGRPLQGSIGGSTAAQPFSADLAPSLAAGSGGLIRHIEEKTKPRQFDCPCCEDCQAFTRLDHVKQHLRSTHRVTKKTAIDALLRPQQAASRNGSRRPKVSGAVAAANPGSALAASSSTASSSMLAFDGPHPTVPYGVGNPANMPGSYAFSAATLATAPAMLPAPPMFPNAGMAGSAAAQPDEAVPAYAGDFLEDFGNMDWTDFTDFTF
ncbi:hypothetical protein VPNG_07787 [Cytospora leucostoma]|uniref:Uncharacterized protein n=1 Tax=Cytospora leucostoma TaxID=1230097 RepID=A0A423WEX4_9PEZI|nr:hypothetical protein VPNG_07787 [Cytospora leucostoma]